MRNKIISVLMCVALSFLVIAPSYLSPKKAHAIAPAIPIAIAVGAVVASGLAAYGIQSVNNGRSVEDVGSSFISWITSKDLDDFWDAQTDIKSAQAAINALYQIGLDGSMNLAQWTYNEQNAIYGTYGALMQLWAADGFAASAPSGTAGSVIYGDLSISTFYSDVSMATLTGGIVNGQYPIRGMVTLTSGESYFWLSGVTPYNDWVSFVRGTDGAWSLSDSVGPNANNPQIYNSFGLYDIATGHTQRIFINSETVDIADISLNTYYNMYFYQCNRALSGNLPSLTSDSGVRNGSAGSLVGSYDASLDLWSGDISYDSGIEGSLFDKFSDALSQGINDLLSQEIPVASDMVYNPSTQALESQGSIPVTLDWSNVLDWADVLNGTRAGTLDGSQSIDGTTSTTAVNTATGTVVTDIALDTALDTPYLSIDVGLGSIAGAMEFAGGQMLDHFPFCTIRDLQALAGVLNTPAQAPYFDLPLVVVDNGSLSVITQRVSLADWEPVAQVLRFMIGLLIVLGFIRVATRQLKVFNEE